jgi:hypothetical protein
MSYKGNCSSACGTSRSSTSCARADCPMWKKVMEEEEKNSKPKVGMNLAMVE